MPPPADPSPETRYAFGPFRLDIERRRILHNERAISWRGNRHFDLLKVLIDAAPEIVSYGDLQKYVWGGKDVDPHTMTQTVKNLRDRLGAYEDCIRNQPGKGYYFDRPPSGSLPGSMPLEIATLLEVAATEWNRRTATSLLRALGLFRQAVDLDPNCVPGLLGVAACITMGCQTGFAVLPQSELKDARAAAQAALRLAADGRTKAAANCQIAQFCVMYDWDFKAAERLLEEARRHDRTNVTMYHFLAHLYLITHRWSEVMNAIDTARRLAPSSPMLHSTSGLMLHFMRRHKEAIKMCESAVMLHPEFSRGYGMLGIAYEADGQYARAIESLETAIELEEHPVAVAWLGHACAVAGKRLKARTALAKLRTLAKMQRVSSYCHALIYSGLGDTEQAVTYLERALAERCDWLIHAGVDPRWDNLRKFQRFQRLIKKVGLPQPAN